MFRILKNVVRVNSTEKEILLGVEFTFTLCEFIVSSKFVQVRKNSIDISYRVN